MITANANYRIMPSGRTFFDYANTRVEVRPQISYDGTTFTVNLGAVVISTIAQVGTPVEPFTEVVGVRSFNLVGENLITHKSNILTLLQDVATALEKYVQGDLETNNTGVTFTRT